MGKSKRRTKKRKPDNVSSSSDSTNDEKLHEKLRLIKRKLKKRRRDKLMRASASSSRESRPVKTVSLPPDEDLEEESDNGLPMSRKEWEKQQCILKKVFDKETTRNRVGNGSGDAKNRGTKRKRQITVNTRREPAKVKK